MKSTDSIAPSTVLHSMSETVTGSLTSGGKRVADQDSTWHGVGDTLTNVGASGGTQSLTQAYEQRQQEIEQALSALKYLRPAAGFAVAIGAKIVTVDLCPDEHSCRPLWKRRLSGLVIDALSSDAESMSVNKADVETLLRRISDANWQMTCEQEIVGAGSESRAVADRDQASCLSINDSLLHANVVTAK